MARGFPPVEELVAGLLSGDRTALSRAITLIESTARKHRPLATELLQAILPHTGKAHRVGITGVPGVGKSTTIDQLGSNLTAMGHKVAVLAVDPSSARTGGSILGDKTRMAQLCMDENAFIRPSPSSGTLGGVTRVTRETMLVCEAAGFDVILVETVGVGQSETIVADMVDFFLVLMLPGAGDELQGIKKGVLELADLIAVNKADGDNENRANRAAAEYRAAVHIMSHKEPDWEPPVVTVSGLANLRLDEMWNLVCKHRNLLMSDGRLDALRQEQQIRWMWSMLQDQLMQDLKAHPVVADMLPKLEVAVRDGAESPSAAVAQILSAFEH